jgi:hypothetical protein
MSYIGVMGCTPRLPDAFPVELPENSGNMVHANAPFEMFKDCVFIKDDVKRLGAPNFATFVNDRCTHLIVTLANTLRLGAQDGAKYSRLQQFLSQIRKPIVIFGLGVQSKGYDLESATLPAEAIEFLKFLGEKCAVVGVRGPYTKEVIEKLSGVRNVSVVGCPSLFSRPESLAKMRNARMVGRPAYAGTNFADAHEASMLASAIRGDAFLVEPVNKFNHTYHLHVSRGGDPSEQIPYFLQRFMKDGGDLDPVAQIGRYFRSNYRLFRSPQDWYRFNTEVVSFTYGTRFHVNMASVLSGRPALWVIHDSRTRELTNYLKLPAIDLQRAGHMSLDELGATIDLTEFFDHLSGHFENFNEYLRTHGLPAIKYNF